MHPDLAQILRISILAATYAVIGKCIAIVAVHYGVLAAFASE